MGAVRYSFQPGPAQLWPDVPALIQQALQEGLLSRYHRDPVWQALFQEAQEAVAAFLGLPKGWLVVFVSSATEAWQVLTDATAELTSLHIVQGAFGERWHSLQAAASPFAYAYKVDMAQPWEPQLEALSQKYGSVGLVAWVQVETSIGAALPPPHALRKYFPQALIAVDATSALGGLTLPWEAVDIAFASVQKCLGLPPGLGVLLLSPEVVERFRDFPRTRFNSLSYLIQQALQHQPPHTPNLLGIYLLAKSLPARPPLAEIEATLRQRATSLYASLIEKGYSAYVPKGYRADSVLSFFWPDAQKAEYLRAKAEAEGLYLGWGYGPEKERFFRIANFPALPEEAYKALQEVLLG